MATVSPSSPTFTVSFPSTRFIRFSLTNFRCRRPSTRRLSLTASLNSTPSDGHVSPENKNLHYELQYGFPPHHRRRGSPVFVTLPTDAVSDSCQLRRIKAMGQSFKALAIAGVEGIVMEMWWGIVERNAPRVYNWQPYLEIVLLARRYGLKVRAVMAFHQCGAGPDDHFWIPLPKWVLEEICKDPDLAYSDRFGRRNMEYISLGCDILPVLRGRSPIQAYADYMRHFRDTFRPFLGGIITGIQVGMGPAGELRYPASPSQKLTGAGLSQELGEFQCYDKYMLASLNAYAQENGVHEWENGGPIGAGNLMQNPVKPIFCKSNGSWNTPYGNFFLEWYFGMLLQHAEKICKEAETIFRGTEVNTSGKVGELHWLVKDGYLPIARMFSRFGFTICCPCFELQDSEEKPMNPNSSSEGFLKQLLMAARNCRISLEGENSSTSFEDDSFQQVLKISLIYLDGLDLPSFSFNFTRMDKNLFEYRNWASFTRFVRQMSDGHFYRAKLAFGGGDTCMSTGIQLDPSG